MEFNRQCSGKDSEKGSEEYTGGNTKKTKLVLITNPSFKDPVSGQKNQTFISVASDINTNFLDVSFLDLNGIRHRKDSQKTVYVCDMQDRTAYKYLEYLEISCSTEMMYMTAEVNFKLSEWDASISLISFTHSLKDIMKKKFSVFSEQENLYDEDLFHIKFRILVSKKAQAALVIRQFSERLERAHRDIFARHAEYQLSLAC